MIIIHMQNHSWCNQDSGEYGNIIQASVGTVFEHSPMSSSRKGGGPFH